MTIRAKATFYGPATGTGRPPIYREGEPVPADVAAQVGDHVLDRSEEDADDVEMVTVSKAELEDLLAEKVAEVAGDLKYTEEDLDKAVDEKLAAAVEEAGKDAVARYQERETAQRGADGYGTFDPAAEGVGAPKVKAYLAGLDVETYAGSSEYERVVAAEKAGPNRSSAIPS